MQRGGFDVVLGNPPWERVKLQEQEFFAARNPEIARAPNKAARERLIKALAAATEGSAERALSDAFSTAKREAEAISEFVRVAGENGGRFALTGRGDVNTYALFAELFTSLTRNRAGVILPTGIATDATTAPFFAHLVSEKRLVSLADFENRERLFPSVYYRVKFCLLTVGRDVPEAAFAFFLTEPGQLAEPERNFKLSPEQIAAINPNSFTSPVFRSRSDAELTAKIYRNAPVLINEGKGPESNLWGVKFATMLHMANDSHLFHTAAQLTEAGFTHAGAEWENDSEYFVPLYEAKMIHQFDHRWAGFDAAGEASADATSAAKSDPAWEPRPRYWVPDSQVTTWLNAIGWRRGWLMGWRDIANVVNERTMIACIFPRAAVGHSEPLFFLDQEAALWSAFCANLNSMTLDFVARQKIGGTHVTYGYLKQFPILPPSFYVASRLSFVMSRVRELTYTSHKMAPFARDLGYEGPPFAWDEDRRTHLRADLDAFYARAYGLNRDELRYILDPADVKGDDYPSETFRVLKEREVRQFGEYRTRRLVLEAWDRMEADGTFVNLGLGAGQIASTAPTVQRPALVTLPDGAWIRAAQQPNDAGAALTAILKAIDGPAPIRTIRLAAAMMLEPHLLTSLLPDARAREWRRLVGQESEPRTGNVVGFTARTNQGWGAAVSNHRGNGRLIENLSAGTWAPGPTLDAFDTAGWPDGRAAFVLEALAALDLNATVTSMPDEVRDWIAHASAA